MNTNNYALAGFFGLGKIEKCKYHYTQDASFLEELHCLDPNTAFENLKNEIFERFLKLNPYIATVIGLHEPYDKIWGDGSSERYHANLALLEEWNKRMKETINYDELSDENKIDWQVIEYLPQKPRTCQIQTPKSTHRKATS